MNEARTSETNLAAEAVQEAEILRHMLGIGSHIPKRQWGYRNYFNAEDGHNDAATLKRLEARGLVIRGKVQTDYWYATEAGCKVAGLNNAQVKKAKV